MDPTWTCGDCGTEYPVSVAYCTRTLDDYLSLRGGSIETAIYRAVMPGVDKSVTEALRRIRFGAFTNAA